MSRFRRVMAEETFVQLAADAIQRRHPQAAWLRDHGHAGNVHLSDAKLDEANGKLAAWIEAYDAAKGTGD